MEQELSWLFQRIWLLKTNFACDFVYAACRQFRSVGADWMFNTNQRNDGTELKDGGVSIDSWGGAVFGRHGGRLAAERGCIDQSAPTPAAATDVATA